MKHLSMLALSLGVALGIPAQAADQTQSREQTQATQQAQKQAQKQAQERERIYGSELMTPQERTEYQNRMRAAKTEQDREALRLEHHKQMQGRAKAQGKTLPDMPPADRGPGKGPGKGAGKGQGHGAGQGQGQGQGMGQGKGGNRP